MPITNLELCQCGHTKENHHKDYLQMNCPCTSFRPQKENKKMKEPEKIESPEPQEGGKEVGTPHLFPWNDLFMFAKNEKKTSLIFNVFVEDKWQRVEVNFESKVDTVEPQDMLGEMVRDFTMVGIVRSKSEVRSRIEAYGEVQFEAGKKEKEEKCHFHLIQDAKKEAVEAFRKSAVEAIARDKKIKGYLKIEVYKIIEQLP